MPFRNALFTFLSAASIAACGANVDLGSGRQDLGNGTRDAGSGTTDGATTDPCSGKSLPTCPAWCPKTMGELRGTSCRAGDACIVSQVGDECSCVGGTWACENHPPLGLGCNKVCELAPSTDPCAGQWLPACPPVCKGGLGDLRGTACKTEGEACIVTKVGDQCSCIGGLWACENHAPLGLGCNDVCR